MTKSPTIRLLLGLLITLAAVTGFSAYSLYQLHNLRRLQTQRIDLNRHDSLLLLRVQNDVDTLGLKLQEMTERPKAASISEYRESFDRIRSDLAEAITADMELAPANRRTEKQAELMNSLQRFWGTADQVFEAAARGNEIQARRLASRQLTDHQIELAHRLSSLLERNNAAEASADQEVAAIYDGAKRDTYIFVSATMLAILVTSLYLIHSNRRLFEKMRSLSRQRRVLAGRLITVQEEVLRSVSRELHDEFGQILTAVGAMLARAERKGLPPDSPFRTELSEVREITHQTLEKMRALSQMLHPAVLDDYGLSKGIEWYAGVFERQTGIQTIVIVRGDVVRITGQRATHCFRIVQEALNNAAKHADSKAAEVEVIFGPDSLEVNIRDFGKGLAQTKKKAGPGLGLIAMRERAELLNGRLDISSQPSQGTVISLVMPLRQEQEEDAAPESEENEPIQEVLLRDL
jgi:signal transduction histidine kinase